MKKFISIVSLVLVALMIMAMPTVAAEDADLTAAPENAWTPPKSMAVYYANDLTGKDVPAIDGIINKDEYGAAVVIGAEPTQMAATWPDYGYIIDDEGDGPLAGTIDYYFAYDETSIYVAFKEYGATYDDGNAAYNDFQARSNYSFDFGFQLDDMTNYICHSVTYGGGCWNKSLSFSDGKTSNFTAVDATPADFYAELFVSRYKADEADLPEDERTLWVYGDVLSASNQNATAAYITEVEMRFDKQQVIEFFNSIAYTEYASCPNAMYFKMTCNAYRRTSENTDGLTRNNKYLVNDIREYNDAQKTKYYMDYGMLPGSPVQIIPSLIVFGDENTVITIPEDKVETEPPVTEPPVDDTEPPVDDTDATANETAPAADTNAPADEGGCGGMVSLAGLALVAALGTCTVFVAKKKED